MKAELNVLVHENWMSHNDSTRLRISLKTPGKEKITSDRVVPTEVFNSLIDVLFDEAQREITELLKQENT